MNDKLVSLDLETSGLNFDNKDPSVNYQIVSIGMVISDNKTFEPQEKLYLEIKPNGVSKFNYKAVQIHGLSESYLEKNGVDEEQAAEDIGCFLHEHFGVDRIHVMGHNVATFDLYFLKSLFEKYNIDLQFSARVYDSFALSMGTVKCKDSDELFDLLCSTKREEHNALDDAMMALESYRKINNIWKKVVEGE